MADILKGSEILDVEKYVRSLPADEYTLQNIENALNNFSGDAIGKKGLASYSGRMSNGVYAGISALRDAARLGISVLDNTLRGQLLTNEGVKQAILNAAADSLTSHRRSPGSAGVAVEV